MAGDMYITECWVDNKLDPTEFAKAFEAHFEGGKAEEKPMVVDAGEGYRLFQLWVAMERGGEVLPFIDQYAATHGTVNEQKPSGTFPFAAGA
ncbi:hypothetical protein KW800_02405 [Candidatus Parcubacteria bacterium]|nr:hypothetical protein [Candidatus Parcubacteria bacterium]